MFWWETVCGLKLSSQDKTKQKTADITQSQVWILWEFMKDNFCYLLVKPLLRGQWVKDGCFEEEKILLESFFPPFTLHSRKNLFVIFIFIVNPITFFFK